MKDWAESLRALTGVDERRIATWLSEVVKRPHRALHLQMLRRLNEASLAG
jgi:hypothetical protein